MKFKNRDELATYIKDVVESVHTEKFEDLQKANQDFVKQFNIEKASIKNNAGEKGIKLARYVRAIAAGRNNPDLAHKWCKNFFGEDDAVTKALAAGDFVAGGAAVPPDFVEEIIELLRPASVVRSLNPVVMPMPMGSMTIPKLTGGATASYVGENNNSSPSEQTFGQLKLTYKKLISLVPMSNDFLEFAMPQSDAVVRDDIVASVAQRSDLAFLRSDGASDTPIGLLYQIASGNKFNANGTVNLDNVTVDLGKALLNLENADVRMLRPGWAFAPRTRHYLMTVRDGNGNYAFRDEMMQGTLWGYPYKVTNQIPITLGGGNESEIYFVDFADVIIGDSTSLVVDASNTAAYYDGANVQSTFSRDQTVIRAIARHDLGMRHDVSGTVIEAVTWGA